MKATDPPLITTEEFNCDPASLWKAITEPDQMKKWFFEQMEDFKAEVGFHTRFNVSNETRTFPHDWTITEVVENNKIVYNWNYKPEYPGNGFVTFEITPINDTRSQLVVNSIVTEDYDESIPEFSRESCKGGWHYFINQRLKAYIDG